MYQKVPEDFLMFWKILEKSEMFMNIQEFSEMFKNVLGDSRMFLIFQKCISEFGSCLFFRALGKNKKNRQN